MLASRAAIRALGANRVVVEVQRYEHGRTMGALHLPLGSAMSIAREARSSIIGVKPRAADGA